MRFALVSVLAAVAALAWSAADLGGVWKGAMETQVGTTDVVITLQPGAALAGKVRVGDYEAPIENARREEDKISFEIHIDPGTVAYQGTVSADEMKLTVTGTQGNQYKLVCRRQR